MGTSTELTSTEYNIYRVNIYRVNHRGPDKVFWRCTITECSAIVSTLQRTTYQLDTLQRHPEQYWNCNDPDSSWWYHSTTGQDIFEHWSPTRNTQGQIPDWCDRSDYLCRLSFTVAPLLGWFCAWFLCRCYYPIDFCIIIIV